MRTITLLGLPGSGKSTVGRSLAASLPASFEDLDHSIERDNSCRLADLFGALGEWGFRQIESEALVAALVGSAEAPTPVSDGSKLVLSLGGGSTVLAANRMLVRLYSYGIYLAAAPSLLAGRLEGDVTRPLLASLTPEQRLEKLMQLHEQRHPQYVAAASMVVDVNDRSPDQIVEEILSRLPFHH